MTLFVSCCCCYHFSVLFASPLPSLPLYITINLPPPIFSLFPSNFPFQSLFKVFSSTLSGNLTNYSQHQRDRFETIQAPSVSFTDFVVKNSRTDFLQHQFSTLFYATPSLKKMDIFLHRPQLSLILDFTSTKNQQNEKAHKNPY